MSFLRNTILNNLNNQFFEISKYKFMFFELPRWIPIWLYRISYISRVPKKCIFRFRFQWYFCKVWIWKEVSNKSCTKFWNNLLSFDGNFLILQRISLFPSFFLKRTLIFNFFFFKYWSRESTRKKSTFPRVPFSIFQYRITVIYSHR